MNKTQKRIYQFIGKISKEIGVKISRKDYPQVEIVKHAGSQYNPKEDRLLINAKDTHSGDAIGEEIGHYLRARLKPHQTYSEKQTSEFFGYLGRRFLQKVAEEGLKFKLKESFETKKEALELAEKYKKAAKRYEEYAAEKEGGLPNAQKYYKLRARAEREKRRQLLEHQRAYEFADKVDLERVNYPELYHLEDKEVRRRFFRDNPKYNRKTIERKLSIGFLVSLAIYFIISQKTIVGNVIGASPNLNGISYLFLGAGILLGGIILYRLVINK